jgi:arylformamidase
MIIHDISLPISETLATWEGQPPIALSYLRHRGRGDHATVGAVSMTLHSGTHVDAPSHHFVAGAGADGLQLETLIGPAFVACALEADCLSAEVLSRLPIPPGSKRVLVRTRNSGLWQHPESCFTRRYVGLTEDGARWIVDQGIGLIGTDYLSVVAWDHLVPGHRVLLSAGVILLEGLDLNRIEPGEYRLVCLPLRVVGGDGAPARAVLIEE